MHMKPNVFIVLFSFLAIVAASAYSEVSFGEPDVNARNEVLFSVTAGVPGGESYRTLFLKKIDTGAMEQLTFFPETMESLADGSILQVRNRFGTCRYDASKGSFGWIYDAKPFRSGGKIGFGALQDMAASPDGHWLVSIEPVSPSRGRLVLYDVARDARCVLADSVDRGPVPVSWAPNSSIMVYSIDNVLYFSRPQAFFSVSSVDSSWRTLGPGGISAIGWYSDSRFLYASGTSIYRVQASELLARSIYSRLIGPGELAGKLPCEFNPSTDSFCASPDGSAGIFARCLRNAYYCPLVGDDYTLDSAPAQYPYILLPGNTAKIMCSWSADSGPMVFAESVEDGKKAFRAWKISSSDGGKAFVPAQMPTGVSSITPSRDGKLAAFSVGGKVSVYSTAAWKEIASFKDEKIVSLCWAGESALFLGGTSTVRQWDFKSGASSTLFLSSVSGFAWDEMGTSVIADAGAFGRFQWALSMKWTAASQARMRPTMAANDVWRLYLDSGKGYYTNMIYARSATSPGGTTALVAEPDTRLDGLAAQAEKSRGDARVFGHGSRSGYRQVALAFDAVDDLDGLPLILHTLDRYRVHATFFINGEFIRQHPAAVNEIVKAGHQTASLFFTSWDLSGTEFRIDKDFIVRGLSRNEDDFYDATGQELTLLWHAPYYVLSPDILAGGEASGYRYVSPDVSVPDWVSFDQGKALPGSYRDASQIIEDIMASKKPGSIIPIRVGKVAGGRKDYLWSKIDLLVNALMESGYEIVPVDTLIKNSR